MIREILDEEYKIRQEMEKAGKEERSELKSRRSALLSGCRDLTPADKVCRGFYRFIFCIVVKYFFF